MTKESTFADYRCRLSFGGIDHLPHDWMGTLAGRLFRCDGRPAGTYAESLSSPQTESHDPVNHPSHYTSHPSGIECIEVIGSMSFPIGSAIKYLWRADEKGAPVEDLKKAIWFINYRITQLEEGE